MVFMMLARYTKEILWGGRKNKGPKKCRVVHFCQNLTILRHSGPASEASAEAESSANAKTQSVLFLRFFKNKGKRLRLLTVALDTDYAFANAHLSGMTMHRNEQPKKRAFVLKGSCRSPIVTPYPPNPMVLGFFL
ncbi:MAG: hypothetical protein ACKO57_00900 [Alphaproteobacteria bacterium]